MHLALSESSMMDEYLYESLLPGNDSQSMIRLIELLPGTGSEDIHCSMKAYPLSDCPDFEALSYCWGDAAIRTPIICNGRQLLVTLNLESALYYLRLHTEPRTLWVDAICINQGDTQERNGQVRIMRSIYQRAERTVIWLGEPTKTSWLAFELCPRIVLSVGRKTLRGE